MASYATSYMLAEAASATARWTSLASTLEASEIADTSISSMDDAIENITSSYC